MDEVFYNVCKERLSRISDSMFYTNQAYCVILQLRDFQENHNELINISPAFYNCIQDCCMEYLFIEVDKMFDPKKEREGVYGLLNKIKDSIDLLDLNRTIESNETTALNNHTMKGRKFDNIVQLVDENIKMIEEAQGIIKKVKTLRDKYFAHREVKRDFDVLFRNNSVSLSDIEALLVLSVNAINALNMYFNDKTLFPITIDYDDFKKTVFYIQKGVETIRKQEG